MYAIAAFAGVGDLIAGAPVVSVRELTVGARHQSPVEGEGTPCTLSSDTASPQRAQRLDGKRLRWGLCKVRSGIDAPAWLIAAAADLAGEHRISWLEHR